MSEKIKRDVFCEFCEDAKAQELKEELEDIYSELRGLLKRRAMFPQMWDTDERLSEWLKKRGELD